MKALKQADETYHRVISSDGRYLKSPAVSPTGVHDERLSDLHHLTRTSNQSEASAWPLQRARYIAQCMFSDASVDPIDARSMPGVFDTRPSPTPHDK